jgi:hypothetical protein
MASRATSPSRPERKNDDRSVMPLALPPSIDRTHDLPALRQLGFAVFGRWLLELAVNTDDIADGAP